MTIASSEQRPPEHRRFGMAVPHVPVPMILFAAAIAVALLVASRNHGAPKQVAHLEGPHPR